MITDEDIKKLLNASATIFATKQDLAAMEERMASKDDFNRVMRTYTNSSSWIKEEKLSCSLG